MLYISLFVCVSVRPPLSTYLTRFKKFKLAKPVCVKAVFIISKECEKVKQKGACKAVLLKRCLSLMHLILKIRSSWYLFLIKVCLLPIILLFKVNIRCWRVQVRKKDSRENCLKEADGKKRLSVTNTATSITPGVGTTGPGSQAPLQVPRVPSRPAVG